MLDVKCLIEILVIFGKFYLSTAETTSQDQYTNHCRDNKQ